MDSMKLLVFLAASLTVSALDLGGVKTVYLLPMANGLDQFLAIKLTTGVILQVVTDPQKADAVLTDHVGGGLEQKLESAAHVIGQHRVRFLRIGDHLEDHAGRELDRKKLIQAVRHRQKINRFYAAQV